MLALHLLYQAQGRWVEAESKGWLYHSFAWSLCVVVYLLLVVVRRNTDLCFGDGNFGVHLNIYFLFTTLGLCVAWCLYVLAYMRRRRIVLYSGRYISAFLLCWSPRVVWFVAWIIRPDWKPLNGATWNTIAATFLTSLGLVDSVVLTTMPPDYFLWKLWFRIVGPPASPDELCCCIPRAAADTSGDTLLSLRLRLLGDDDDDDEPSWERRAAPGAHPDDDAGANRSGGGSGSASSSGNVRSSAGDGKGSGGNPAEWEDDEDDENFVPDSETGSYTTNRSRRSAATSAGPSQAISIRDGSRPSPARSKGAPSGGGSRSSGPRPAGLNLWSTTTVNASLNSSAGVALGASGRSSTGYSSSMENSGAADSGSRSWGETMRRRGAAPDPIGALSIPFSLLSIDDDAPLGGGATSMVFRGVYQGVAVAVKEMAMPASHREHLEQFFSEVRLLASARHENLVNYFGVSLDTDHRRGSGRLFIVMELYPHTLSHMLADTALGFEQRRTIARGIALGMACLHSLDIVHRDLKVENVFLSANLEPRIGDFGVSQRRAFSGLVRAETFGTPAYLAPEAIGSVILRERQRGAAARAGGAPASASETSLLEGDLLTSQLGDTLHQTMCYPEPPSDGSGDDSSGLVSYNHKVDVYAYGLLLWSLFAGLVPYSDMHFASLGDFFAAVVHGLRPDIAEVRRARFGGAEADIALVVELIERCLAEDPEQRPEFAEAAALLKYSG